MSAAAVMRFGSIIWFDFIFECLSADRLLDYGIDGFNVFIFKNVSEEEYSVQRNWKRKNIEDSIPSKTTSVGDLSGFGRPRQKIGLRQRQPSLSLLEILEYCGVAATYLHIILVKKHKYC